MVLNTKVCLWSSDFDSDILGTWLQGRKHGFGRQIYVDETGIDYLTCFPLNFQVYSGQFANGFEHGIGKRSYKDGSHYEGLGNFLFRNECV